MRGRLLAQRYRIERNAGAGGMAHVYRAVDERSGQLVAVKVLRVDHGYDLERFRREGLMLAEISHPFVVRHVDHGTTESGEPFLVMEWIEGETLSARLAGYALTVLETIIVGIRLADALAALHLRGLVHRDIKPSNVILRGGELDRATLVDFGIVRRLDAEQPFTQTGAVLGTPGYMAPEQLRGHKNVDARVDVFALGVLLFKCVTGTLPFDAPDPVGAMMSVLLDPAPRITELQPGAPEALEDLILRMLAKNPSERPRDALTVLQELQVVDVPRASVAPPISMSHAALTSTEQAVTCLVLVGSRKLGASTRPANLLQDATIADASYAEQERAVDAVASAHGGEPLRLEGGVLVVVMTASSNLLDLALRAGRCALAMRWLRPGLPMAIVSGRAKTLATARSSAVLARGLEILETANPDEGIRLDDPSRALLQDRLDIEVDARGGLLRGELGGTSDARMLLGKAVPCVGRDRELGALRALFDEVVDEPVARVALVTGAPGVGKSRVRHEILRELRDRAEVWTSRGDPMSAGSTFGLLAQLVQDAAKATQGDVAARVARLVERSEAPRVAAFLRELTGDEAPDGDTRLRAARQSPVLMGDQIRLAFEDFLVAECAARPVVLVLEDLHWGDLPTIKCIDGALRRLADAPLFVLALARREVHELFPKLWEARRVQELHLAELTPKASRKLIRQALGAEIPEARVDELVQRAGGNAFYLEELIRALASGRDGDLPDTVLAMADARLARLDPEARRVLRAGAVFGQVFWRSGVVALLGGPGQAPLFDTWLSWLIEQELVTSRSQSRFRGEPEYVFRHALLRDAAYASLTQEDAALGHRLAAAWLERAGETNAASLAEHYERGRERANAARWYAQAADQALEGDDLAYAIEIAERGRACGAAGEDLGHLEGAAARAHQQRGENAAAEAHGALALSALERGTAYYFETAAQVVAARGRLAHVERLLELADEIEATRPEGAAAQSAKLVALSAAFIQALHVGEEKRAKSLREALLRADLPRLDTAAAGWIHRAHGTWSAARGDFGGFLDHIELAVEAFDRAGDLRSACMQRVNVGYGHLELGAYAEAEPVLTQALADAERLGAHNAAGMARNNLGLVLARRGATAQGIEVERAAIDAFVRFGDRRMESGSRTYLAIIHRERGDLGGAEEEARTAARVIENPSLRAFPCGVLARVLASAGAAEEALAVAREAVASLGSEGESEIRLALVEALLANGAFEEAKDALASARVRLLARATKITDPERRESFLTRVPENALTLSLEIEQPTATGSTIES